RELGGNGLTLQPRLPGRVPSVPSRGRMARDFDPSDLAARVPPIVRSGPDLERRVDARLLDPVRNARTPPEARRARHRQRPGVERNGGAGYQKILTADAHCPLVFRPVSGEPDRRRDAAPGQLDGAW